MAAGPVAYGGQFGSYLPIAYGLRDILTFVDVQDYNSPPLQGIDGEIYQSHTVDYHAALTELLLHGFDVDGNPKYRFPAMPPQQVAVGFYTDYDTPELITRSMRYLLSGNVPAGTHYRFAHSSGYPDLLGAMFWTIDDDRNRQGRFSGPVGDLLHR
jgi:hypothetical protein